MAVTPQTSLPTTIVDEIPGVPNSGTDLNAASVMPNFQALRDSLNTHTHTEYALGVDLNAHTSATTNVHGIPDTSQLVTTSDSRLSDQRVPTDGSVTDAKVASNATISYSKLALSGMIQLSDLAFTAIQSQNVEPTSSTVWVSSRVTGDAFDRFTVKADGSLGWGAGDAAQDIGLFRNGSLALLTNATIQAAAGFFAYQINSSVNPFKIQVSGDSVDRFQINSNGKLAWGPGDATVADTNLYRAAAGSLKTDGSLTVGATTAISANNVYYTGGGAWGVGSQQASGDVYLDYTTAGFLYVRRTGGSAWMRFGASKLEFGATASSPDTNLYRSATSTLKTDNALVVGSSLTVGAISSSSSIGSTRALFTNPALYTLVTGDTINRFQVSAGGVIQWSDGTNSADTTLYRSSANVLTSDDTIQSSRSSATSPAFSALVVGDTVSRFIAGADGKLNWGSGSLTQDTNLYRSSAGVLTTDGQLTVANSINTGNAINFTGTSGFLVLRNQSAVANTVMVAKVSGDTFDRFTINTGGQINWGNGVSSVDTNLYRAGTNQLQTDGQINLNRGGALTNAALLIKFNTDTGYRFFVDASGKQQWADGTNPTDTNLYRLSAGILKTDGKFIVGSTLQTGGDISIAASGALIARTQTATTSIALASRISTDTVDRYSLTADGKQTWGSGALAADTNLYRSSAGVLKTDTSLQIGGNLQVGSYQVLSATADPGVAAAGSGRLYLKNNGSGKMQLVVQMPTGVPIVLATEA